MNMVLSAIDIDNTISDQHIIDTPNLDFFKRDRNIHGGRVLIVTNKLLRATELNINTGVLDEEILFVKI